MDPVNPRMLRGEVPEYTKAAAIKYGYGQGTNALHGMLTPRLRPIGFPFPVARPGQLAGVDAVLDAFQAGNDVLFEAGTGYGKSPLEIAVASHFESAYLLIGRNDLVDQWERDFEHFDKIGFYKSRQRFDCELIKDATTGQKMNCSKGKRSCDYKRAGIQNQNKSNSPANRISCPACPYAVNRDVSLAKPYTVMTLALGLTAFKYLTFHPQVVQRDLLVIDECSELESEIMKFFEFQVSTKSVLKAISPSITMRSFYHDPQDLFYARWPGITPSMGFGEALGRMRPENELKQAIVWAIDIAALAGMVRDNIQIKNKDTEEIKDECDKITRMATNMGGCVDEGVPYFALVEGQQDEDHYTVKVSPLEARGMVSRLMAPFAKHLLFVSATTGTPQMFQRTHNYDRPIVKIETPSTFPVENRRVYALCSGNMSAKTQVTDAPKVMDALVAIAKYNNPERPQFCHANQKGIIHTYNNKVTDMVAAALDKAGMARRRIILRGGGRVREEAMTLFRKSSDPLILISPSAMLGLSLDDDLGRWQAIVKLPYPYLGDPSVEHRKDNIPDWYEWQTAKDLIQTFGRIVRSNTDWGMTYVLDAAFSRFYGTNAYLFPKYIREAIWEKT